MFKNQTFSILIPDIDDNENFSDDQQTTPRTEPDIANDLRGKMGADEFRDYMLGFIFFKFLSEKMLAYANKSLEPDGITYTDLADHPTKDDYLAALKSMSLNTLGYFQSPINSLT